MSSVVRAGVALGSNEGDRMGHLRAAVRWLEKESANPVLISCVYETAPIGCPEGTPSFLNAACEMTFQGNAVELLEKMRDFERQRGRPVIYSKNSPRPLDMDLLYAGDLVLQTDQLTLPHPRMLQRRFVLQPLGEIRPDLVLPGQTQTVAEILKILCSQKPEDLAKVLCFSLRKDGESVAVIPSSQGKGHHDP